MGIDESICIDFSSEFWKLIHSLRCFALSPPESQEDGSKIEENVVHVVTEHSLNVTTSTRLLSHLSHHINNTPANIQLLYSHSTNNHANKMSGWEVRFSNSKQLPYFYNPATSQSVWEKPDGLSEDQLSQLPGAQYLSAGKGAAAAGASGSGGVPAGKVRASHILAKHAGSRRPSSWRQVSSPSFTINRP